MKIKLILSDIDGVWTDGGMYYSSTGEELKKFNTADSAGVLFSKLLGIKVGIITGEDVPMVKRRADKLKLDYAILGAKNKVKIVSEICTDLGITFDEVAYIGDDINDMALLKEVGYSASPSNAPSYVQDVAQFVIPVKGGDGAFRAFVEKLLIENDLLDTALEKYFESLQSFNQ
jgi:3-deoxy-D-manno-octulosonate 8-phosphate phosphatase (KDO 8-P phosphatase)